ncbi:MAG: DNA cytosine methyltransferase [Kiritimatiellae bacterium]|nr:DNA cytosine methyltransferase [Kiritimatiellia bacterium]
MDRRLLPPRVPAFDFIDLFAGIGGFRLAMQQEGGRCVFASEIDPAARQTYARNFGVVPFGDITDAEVKSFVPARFDILCGGFPCQAFSMAGKRRGIEDLERGTLYREIVEIARRHRPKALFLENVRGLLSSHGGADWETIRREIEAAGFRFVFDGILNSKDYGVPQNRERLYMVALRDDLFARMERLGLSFPSPPPRIAGPVPACIGDIRERDPAQVPKSFYLGESYLRTLLRHKARHKDSGRSGFGFIVRRDEDIAGTLMCGGMGRERNMLQDAEDFQPDWTPPTHMKGAINAERYRFMTIRERARLQGFPDWFRIPDSISAGQKQFGNCVTVGAVRAVGRALVRLLERIEEN